MGAWIVGTVWASDQFGVMQVVNAFVLLIQLIAAAFAIAICAWRGVEAMAGHLESIAKVILAIVVGIGLIAGAPQLVRAAIPGAAGAVLVANGVLYPNEAIGDGVSMLLVVSVYLLLPMWLVRQGRGAGG